MLEVLPEARLVVEGDFAGGRVVEAVDGTAEQGSVFRHGVPEADAAEGDCDDGVVERHRLGLDAEEVLAAVLDGDFGGFLVEGHALDCGLEDCAVQDLGAEGAGEVREAFVDCSPFRGEEVDAFVEPIGENVGDVGGLIGNVVGVAELVLQVACFGEVEVAVRDGLLVGLEDVGGEFADLSFIEILPFFERVACFRDKGGVGVASVGIHAVEWVR